jgi:hypothetical protein
MRHEPSDSCLPVQQAPRKRCRTCQQARSLADFQTTEGSHSASCHACRRAAARLASRRRAAAMRLLIALHPEEWAGLLGLVRGGRQAASHAAAGGGDDG